VTTSDVPLPAALSSVIVPPRALHGGWPKLRRREQRSAPARLLSRRRLGEARGFTICVQTSQPNAIRDVPRAGMGDTGSTKPNSDAWRLIAA
jgi:hypothetical protein